MAVYRKFSPIMEHPIQKKSPEELVTHFDQMEKGLENLNKELGYAYNSEISRIKALHFLSGVKNCLSHSDFIRAIKFTSKTVLAFLGSFRSFR